MRRLWALGWCVVLLAASVTPLRQLFHQGRMFQLRRTLMQQASHDAEAALYRAVVEARFGHETTAVEDLRQFLATHPQKAAARQANEEMASALVRMGRYGEAAKAWEEALRLTPPRDAERLDNENTRALYQALSGVVPQTVAFGEDVRVNALRNPLGSWDVPVEVNGRKGEWIFDTGASMSTVTESEAARMGLSIWDTSTYVKGSTAKKNPLRVAVAADLRLGRARLRNVVFLVLADEALHVGPAKYQISGIVGLPLIRALGRVEVSAKGVLRMDTHERAAPGEPNMFFEELMPIVETLHGERRLQMFLDTGANVSVLYPSLRDALGKDEIAKLQSHQERIGGAGGIVTRRTAVIPTLRLEVLGRTVDLPKVSLLLKQPEGQGRYRDGVLGMDAVANGFTLDFRTMQFLLQP